MRNLSKHTSWMDELDDSFERYLDEELTDDQDLGKY